MDDNSRIWFGDHAGKTLINVPDKDLIFWWGENKVKFEAGNLGGRKFELMEYIEDNIDERKL